MQKPRRPAKTGPSRHSLSYQLREIIDARGLSAYAAGQLADVDPGVVSRFMRGQRDVRLETADRLATALGLRLVEVARKARPARPGRATGPATIGDIGDGDRPDVDQLDQLGQAEGLDRGALESQRVVMSKPALNDARF